MEIRSAGKWKSSPPTAAATDDGPTKDADMDDLAGDDVSEPTLLIMLYTSVEARSSISKVQVRKIAYLVLNISDSY